ncbi:MAG TPA: GTP-binding protein [Usitatibacteraceae bacterium]|nr:GTP-binding protein [Usitatibacteraceae bacterium]
MTATTVTPVTLLTGFLGSGKTTLLNRLLGHPEFGDCAVIVNEFGPVAIDHVLVRTASENVVLLPSGCVCCQVAGDLVQALRDLYFKRAAGEIPAFRRAIIETTGLADPAPLARTLIELPLVAARYSLAGIVTTVDGQHGSGQLDRHPEATKQAAVADRLVITKTDLAEPPALEALEGRLAALNPGAVRLRSARGDADPQRLLDTGLYRGSVRLADAGSWLNAGAYRRVGDPMPAAHDPRVTAFAWFAGTPVSWPAFEDALATLLDLAGERILRLKGLVNVAGEAGPVAVHAVQHTLYPPAPLPSWPDGDRRTRLVFIVRDLEESFVAQMLDSELGTLPYSALQQEGSVPCPER